MSAMIMSQNGDEEEQDDTEEVSSSNDDDYYKKLAEWEPGNFQPLIETDDDGDVDDEDETIIQTTTAETIEEDNAMDISSDPVVSSSQVDDLLVTFIHRPVKSEPMNYDDEVFDRPPQLDGHVDLPSTESSSQLNRNNDEKKLNEIIAKFTEKKCAQKRTIQIFQIPSTKPKLCSSNDSNKKSLIRTSKTSITSPKKSDQPKPPTNRDGKLSKKPMSRIFNTVMKNNVDAIRESDTRKSTTSINTHRTSRIQSDSGVQSTTTEHRHYTTMNSYQQKTSTFIQQQKRVPDNPRKSIQSKEKSASDHMKLAQRKLNNFQERQQQHTKSSVTNISSIPSISQEKVKKILQPSKSIDPSVRRSVSTSTSSNLIVNDQQVKKKQKKLKRLSTKQSELKSNNSLPTKTNLPSKNNPSNVVNENVTNKEQQQQTNSNPSESSSHPIHSNTKVSDRPATHFDGCIVIDDDTDDENEHNIGMIEDDDIQEIEQQQYSVAYNIRARQKDLDHIVHSSPMGLKWLFNLENLLLDHILICHENQHCPCKKSLDKSLINKCINPCISTGYQIESSFISIILINFIKIFLLRNSLNDQQEFSFVQFSITSHLRYLLLDLPTYIHNEEKDLDENCSKCHQYSLIINILFDLLFDLIDYDLCGRNEKIKYRSSLIEDDYFTRFLQSKITKKNPFYRIKLIIYFIELLGLHMNQCRKKKQFQFNQNENTLFHSIEEFIRHIISRINNMINERISICFNIMELCLLFVNEKASRIKQMSLFLAELCHENFTYLNFFLFDENLFVDIRLLLINELISKKFHRKLTSYTEINDFFLQIQDLLNRKEKIDESALVLLRSLFNSYADLIIEIKTIPSIYSNEIKQLKLLLEHQFDALFHKLVKVSIDDQTYFQQIERTLIFFRLLKCKWNKL
ncbi:hypothetical protein I4U23_009653 [Adineta vaga]|nr:hypothetical protein I4U23_009653 [Adineta vaga]